jgi:hypothetical protein
MKTIFKIVGLFVVILSFQHCNEQDEVFYPVSQELKDWGAFKLGTYWVYKEENLNIYDTIKIYKLTSEKLQIDKYRLNHFWERVNSYFYSTRQIDSGYFKVASFSGAIAMIHENSDLDEYVRKCYLIKLPPVKGDWIRNGSPDQINRFDTIYSTYKLGNFEFTNVVRANDNFNYFYLGTPTLIYSVKNIGIIRKEFPEYGQVWNLVDYHIVQ